MNGLQIYRGDTLIFPVSITSDLAIDLSQFTPIMVIDFLTGVTYISGSTITNGSTTFEVQAQQNDVEPRVYEYEIYLEDQDEKYTLIQDSYSVLEAITSDLN